MGAGLVDSNYVVYAVMRETKPRSASLSRTALRVVGALLLLASVALATTACGNLRTGEAEIHGIAKFKMPAFPKTGGHAVLLFSEMHYQPSYRSQEGPRLLPPIDSVPVTGRQLDYTQEEYAALLFPEDITYDADEAARLFDNNCMVCHGKSMRGDGMIAKLMEEEKIGPVPADLMAPLTQDSSRGELFGFISDGGRQGQAVRLLTRNRMLKECEGVKGFAYSDCIASARRNAALPPSPMPEFWRLLTAEERWTLVRYLRPE